MTSAAGRGSRPVHLPAAGPRVVSRPTDAAQAIRAPSTGETAVADEGFPAVLRGTFGRLSPDRHAERERALQAILAAGGGTFDGLVAVVRDRAVTRATREDAMWFLGQWEDDRVTPVLLELAADHGFDLRELAAWWLGHRHDMRAAPAML